MLVVRFEFPSLKHVFLVVLFGPIAGIILWKFYRNQDMPEMASWFWRMSWVALAAAVIGGLVFIPFGY